MTIVYYINISGPLVDPRAIRITRSIQDDPSGPRLVKVYLIYQEAPGAQLVQFMEVALPGHPRDPVTLS
jgi:hypothetical protein